MSSMRALLLAGTALASASAAQTLAPDARPVLQGVVAGGIIVRQDPMRTEVVQSQPRGIVEWRRFDVGAQHEVAFRQPSAGAVTLNRVRGPDPSVIAGRVTANGTVAIVNPSGVVFSRGSQVDVGGLIASSADIANDAFLRERRLVFDRPGNPDARIENRGTITVREAGLAALVAPQVANHGVITARMGRVALAGGETHAVDLYGDGLLSIEVLSPTGRAPADGAALVTNTGTIAAEGGVVHLTAAAADGIVQDLVRAGGTVRAGTGRIVVAGSGGTVRVEGALDATGTAPGARGGSIEVNGDRVAVASTARIGASGRAGGGTVAIGTTPPGAARPRLARRVGIAPGAEVRADATEAGRGGTVLVNSSDITVHAGAISARGGPGGGDGGFVEVSGRQGLRIPGTVDVAAGPGGAAGTFLIDPITITIVAGTGPDDGAVGPDGELLAGDPPDNAQIGNLFINGFEDDLRLEATTLITVDAAINKPSGALTLVATAGSIVINAAVQVETLFSGTASLNMLAASDITIGAALTANTVRAVAGGNVTVTSAGAVTGGTTVLAAGSVPAAVDAPSLIPGAAGALTLNGAVFGGALLLQAGTSGISQGTAFTTGNLSVVTTGGAVLRPADSTSNQTGTFGASDVADSLTLDTLTSDLSVDLFVDGDIRVGGTLSVTVSGGGIVQNPGSRILAGRLEATTDFGSISLFSANEIGVLGQTTAPEFIEIRNRTDLRVEGPVRLTDDFGGFINVTVSEGSLTVAGVVAADIPGFGSFSLNASGSVLILPGAVISGVSGEGSSVIRAGFDGEVTNPDAAAGIVLGGTVTEADSLVLRAGTLGIVQTDGSLAAVFLSVSSGGSVVLDRGGATGGTPNAVTFLGTFVIPGDFVLDNGVTDIQVAGINTAANIGLRTSGALIMPPDPITAGPLSIALDAGTGLVSLRVNDLDIQGGDRRIIGGTIEIAPNDPRPLLVPVEPNFTSVVPTLGVTTDELARMSFSNLRLGATTFGGTIGTSATNVTIVAPVGVPGTLDLRGTAEVRQLPGAAITAAALTGASGSSTTLTEPGNLIGTLAGFAAGGDFRLRSGGGTLAIPAGAVVSAGGVAEIVQTGGGIAIDGTVTGAATTLITGGTIRVSGLSAIARSGDLVLTAPVITIDGLISAANNILLTATTQATIGGQASAGGLFVITSPSVLFNGLAAGGTALLLDLGAEGSAAGALDVGVLTVRAGLGVQLTGSIAGIGGEAAAARGRRQDVAGLFLPDPPERALDFLFNACPIGVAVCRPVIVPDFVPPDLNGVFTVADGPAGVTGGLVGDAAAAAAVAALRRNSPPLIVRPAGDREEEQDDMAPPDIRPEDF
jgi:filamentous hemagglutinin family protein